MSSSQSAVDLPPLSTIAAVTYEPNTISDSSIGGASSLNLLSGVDRRDVRIKDPMPKKLKGQTSSLNGNFGVIQMELGCHETSLERDEIAKRASESTELAAMRAYHSRYSGVSSTKRFVRMPDETGAWDNYYAGSSANKSASPAARTLPLTPIATKEEQARLLTLLRSLPPPSVVDQICKALAYFGGIPGAAPPPDGVFPRSELTNGSGSVFVGWVAEIFPKLANETTIAMKAMQHTHLNVLPPLVVENATEATNATTKTMGGRVPDFEKVEPAEKLQPATATADGASSTEKRRRGRPKGSKATKVRRDKGIKKGPSKARTAIQPSSTAKRLQPGQHLASPNNDGAGDDSWVNVDDDDIMDVTGVVGDGLFFSASQEASNSSNANSGAQDLRQGPNVGAGSEVTLNSTEYVKKRGRPKGSKNRPKVTMTIASNSNSVKAAQSTITPIPPPVVPNTTASLKKSNIDRPKGATTKRLEFSALATTSGADAAQNDHETLDSTLVPRQRGPSSGATFTITSGKRKRAETQKQDSAPPDTAQSSLRDGIFHAGQPVDLLHPMAQTAKKQKQRKVGDSSASVQNSTGSASPATDSVVNMAAARLGQAEPALLSHEQIMPPLDVNDGADETFNAASFEESSRLGQNTSAPLTNQHQHHDQTFPSLHRQQQQQQQQQQQRIDIQNPMSSTPPFHGSESVQGISAAGRNQTHQQNQQPQRQRLGHAQSSHQANTCQQAPGVSGHVISSTPSQHSNQTQMTTSLPSGSIASQQLPRLSRTPQPFYAQNRTGNNNQFSQSPPLPQQQQQEQQQNQKQQFPSHYQSHGPYSSQKQQQQPFTSQQRHPSQSISSSSPRLLSQSSTAHRSPQFSAPSASELRAVTVPYGTSPSTGAMGFESSSYDQTRRPNATGSPLLGTTYGASGTVSHSLDHHASPSFGTSRPQKPSSALHTQNVNGTTSSMQSFHGFDTPSLFDSISLDAANGGGDLGLGSPAAYSLSGGVSRTSSNTGGFGPTPSIIPFDANMGGNDIKDRFYGVRR